ncbi:uncharacterized protein LOC129874894 isoform X1 [Solanum dulcamara]|uniref:uncharacterized protein LOC129874894 isoform X1 n=1 Tax=Solanum dulcamara TaxID=45834 RepID=UPI0024866A3C|nr:uncharacterized protein LOC129874894 isoform X1 [Solanum dulcamara]XP_055806246.1 uncharacterized protein LOC129874894 isoform X1 [Solanum dulcamara]
MQTYQDKSHDELRFEDYQLGAKGNESTTLLLKSSGFGKSAFGINHEGSRTTSYIATPEIDSTRPGGANIQSICGMQTYQDKSHDELRFEDYQLGDKGTLAFNAAMNATSSRTQSISPGSSTLQTFGKKYDVNSVAKESLMRDANVSDSSILGYPRAPAFGVPSNSHSATPRFDSYSFGQPAVSISGSKGKESTAPLLKSSGFVKSAFGINQKRSRTASYIATPDIDCTIPDGAKIQSICGMQTYKDKSQEELRFEDYQSEMWFFMWYFRYTGIWYHRQHTAFGVPNNSHFGTPRFDSYSFANQQYPCQRAKETEVHHLCSIALVLESLHLVNQKGK